MKRSWNFGSFEVTALEILASVTIIAVMLILGFVFSGEISSYQTDKNAEYYKAAKITDTNMFQYGMDTSLGNAFVYGDLMAVDSVSFPELDGQYLYVEKVEEHYNRHTRTVEYKDSDGKKRTKEEVYYTWDYVSNEEIHSQRIRFCGIEMDYSKILMPSSDYIKTIKKPFNVRFKYYVCKPKYTGTIYTDLRNGEISKKSMFYNERDIETTVDSLTSNTEFILFWIFWLVLTGFSVFGFFYLDNRWSKS